MDLHESKNNDEQIRADLKLKGFRAHGTESGYRGWVQGCRLILQGLVFPFSVPVFAAWCPNGNNEARVAADALETGALKVTDVILGDETFGKGEFPELNRQAGGFVLAPQFPPSERRSWKDDLYVYLKETIELLFQRLIQAADLKECKVKGEGRNSAFVL